MSGAAAKRQMRRQLQGRGLGGAGGGAGTGAPPLRLRPPAAAAEDSPSAPRPLFQKSKTSSARSWGREGALQRRGYALGLPWGTLCFPRGALRPHSPRDPKVRYSSTVVQEWYCSVQYRNFCGAVIIN